MRVDKEAGIDACLCTSEEGLAALAGGRKRWARAGNRDGPTLRSASNNPASMATQRTERRRVLWDDLAADVGSMSSCAVRSDSGR